MSYSNFYSHFYASRDKAQASWRTIFSFKPSLTYLALLIFLQLSAWFQAWFIRHNLTGDILVLHYNADSGIDWIGDPIKIYFYPLLGLGITILDFLILAVLHKDRNFKILAHFLWGAAVLFAIFLNIALFAVYLINFR